jgi:phage host-nuclease inhibitor protein Gam
MKKQLESMADVELALNELQEVEAKIDLETAGANKDIANIRTTIVPSVSKLEEQATRIRNSIETWAEGSRDDEGIFPKGKKTLELRAGTISFRESAPSLVLLEGWKSDDVLVELKDADAIIRKAGIKEAIPTLDKTAIKKLYDQGKIDDKTLRSLGLKITTSETLTVSTKKLEAYSD